MRRAVRLLLMAFLMLPWIWFSTVIGTAVHQRNAARTITFSGATIYYDWMIQPIPGTPSVLIFTDQSDNENLEMIRDFIGDEYYNDAVRIDGLDPYQVDARVLSAIATYPELRSIVLRYRDTNERMTEAEFRNLKSRIDHFTDAKVLGPYWMEGDEPSVESEVAISRSQMDTLGGDPGLIVPFPD